MSKEEPTVQENVEVVSTMSMVSFREIAGDTVTFWVGKTLTFNLTLAKITSFN